MNNRKFSIEEMRKNNFFVLYDMYDNICAYYDNCEELEKNAQVRVRLSEIVYKFNKSKFNYVLVIWHRVFYKLYTFTDDDLLLVNL